MTQIAKKAARQGWQEEERQLLYERVRTAREQGQPLRSAFESIAQATGRKPNSVRNYYYAAVKEGELTVPGDRNAFTPFTQEEIETLIETVLSAQAHGISVRSITMTMGEGDKKAMLRYQNKYRSMVKNYPETVLAVYRRMQEEGKDTFNPYSQQRPHKSGRKPGSSQPPEVDETVQELVRTLRDIKTIDAAAFLQQLATLVSMASQARDNAG